MSGNVSLYNETHGQAILPTPTIGGVGLIADWRTAATMGGMAEGDTLILLGGDGTHLGQSIYLRDCLGRADGPPPPVDLGQERRNGDFVRSAIHNGQVSACHDLSSGGMALALAEMCMAAKSGVKIALAEDLAVHGQMFGEDQARYLIAVPQDMADFVCLNAEGAGVPFRKLGTVGGQRLVIESVLDVAVTDLASAHEAWFPEFMDGKALENAA